MQIQDLNLLGKRESFILELEVLLRKAGFDRQDFAQFDEYELFDKNRAFIEGAHLLTFTDSAGTLMALRPDVTLSVMKQAIARPEKQLSIYYHEDVFRFSQDTHQYETHSQIGAERIEKETRPKAADMLSLVQDILKTTGTETVLVLSHMGFFQEDPWYNSLAKEDQKKILSLIERKSRKSLSELLESLEAPSRERAEVLMMTELSGPSDQVLSRIKAQEVSGPLIRAAEDLNEKAKELSATSKNRVIVDLSLVNPLNYYNGLVFQGFAKGCSGPVLSGGRYDLLAERFLSFSHRMRSGICGAIGFAVDLDELSPIWK